MQGGCNHKYEKQTGEKSRDLVKKTTEYDTESSFSSDDEFISHAINHLNKVKKVKRFSNVSKTVALSMNEVNVRVEPDSRADVNLMDEHQYKALLKRSEEKPILEASQIKLSTLQNELPLKGEFVTTLRNETSGTLAKIVVIRGHINSPPLISKGTLMELGMLEIREDGSLGKRNDMRIQKAMPSINTVASSLSTNEECSDSKEDSSRGTNGEDTRVDSCRVGKQTT